MTSPRVVVHIPHASPEVPPDVAASLRIAGSALERELLAMTDWYTDEIFTMAPERAATVRFPVSRLVVDPERFEDDAREPMSRVGMGVIYTRTSQGSVLRAAPPPDERAHLLQRFYRPHHARLRAAVAGAIASHGTCLLVDAHSFPSAPLPYESDQRADRPDICIGTDDFHTPARLRDTAVRAFESAGWEVAVDRPFAGTIVPMDRYRCDARVSSVMIELNRRLYLDEATGQRHPDMAGLCQRLRAALDVVFALAPGAPTGR